MMQLRCFECSEYRTVYSADVERARHDQQPLLDVALKLPPQLIGHGAAAGHRQDAQSRPDE